MTKKLSRIIVLIIFCLLLVGAVWAWQNLNSPTAPALNTVSQEQESGISNEALIPEPIWQLAEQGKQYEIYYAENVFEYSYKIYDKEGKLRYDSQRGEYHLKSLGIAYISDDIMNIHASAGTYANMEQCYDVNNDLLSQWFQNPYMVFDDCIVYYDANYLVVQNIFGRDFDSCIFPCDFITTAAPSHIELSDDKTKLSITQLKSDGLTKVSLTFDIKVNSERVSAVEKSEKYDEFHYVNARLPVVQGIGSAVRTQEINAQYLVSYDNELIEVKKSYDNPVHNKSETNFREAANALLVDCSFRVAAETENYLAIKMYYSWYGGGMHPLHSIWFDNYDVETGRILTLEDFLGDIPDWRERLENELDSLNKKREGYTPWGGISMLEDRDAMFFVENGNLHIFYNEYEIAPYSDRIIEFAIPISSLHETQ